MVSNNLTLKHRNIFDEEYVRECARLQAKADFEQSLPSVEITTLDPYTPPYGERYQWDVREKDATHLGSIGKQYVWSKKK